MNKSELVTDLTFFLLFSAIGMGNIILVHFFPGLIYLLLSIFYLPETNRRLKNKFGFSIPFTVKLLGGLVILWGTIAVGDLAEIIGL